MQDIFFETSHIFVMFLCLLGIVLYLLTLLLAYRAKVHKQNIQLIKLYLDRKFISKLLSILNNNNDARVAYGMIINNIKSYYHLDAVVIYSRNQNHAGYIEDEYHNKIRDYTHAVYDEILSNIKSDGVVIKIYQDSSTNSVLHIIPISYDNDNCAIFVQKSNKNILDPQEIEMIASAIAWIINLCVSRIICKIDDK